MQTVATETKSTQTTDWLPFEVDDSFCRKGACRPDEAQLEVQRLVSSIRSLVLSIPDVAFRCDFSSESSRDWVSSPEMLRSRVCVQKAVTDAQRSIDVAMKHLITRLTSSQELQSPRTSIVSSKPMVKKEQQESRVLSTHTKESFVGDEERRLQGLLSSLSLSNDFAQVSRVPDTNVRHNPKPLNGQTHGAHRLHDERVRALAALHERLAPAPDSRTVESIERRSPLYDDETKRLNRLLQDYR